MFYIVTGGSASGKSEYAESLAISSDARQRFYIATMKPWDEEGRRRIQKHRAMRAGKGFLTIEQPRRLKEAAKNVKVNSTKSMIGHLLGAAGGVEFITCVKSINEGYIHETVGLTEPDEELDLDYVMGQGVETNVDFALSNSLGFGGHNATLAVRKYSK